MSTGNTCCAFGCLKTKQTNPECSFIKLPDDKKRKREWFKIIGRSDLIDRTTRESYYVCSSHFEDDDLKHTSSLKPNAVPCRHLPKRSFFNTPQDSSVDWDEVFLNPSIIESPKDPLAENEDDEATRLTEPTVPILQDDLTLNMRKLMQDPSILNKDRTSKDFIDYAFNLYLLNPQVYRFIRDALNLPSEKVFRKMNLKLSPKLDSRSLDYLSAKLKSFPDKAKYCTLCIETMYLKSNLYYDITSDELVGLQEAGGVKSDEAASVVYIITLRSILVKWDQVVTYCFLAGFKNCGQLEPWIDSVIISLLDIGFEIKALVTNQGSNFKKIASEVKEITPDHHYFILNNKKIYYIFEAPQLVHVIRNNLGTKDIYHNKKRVSWQYINKLFQLESKSKNKLIPKLTARHISVFIFGKNSSVKYAAEVFSNTVAKAIHTYVNTREMPEEARDTAHFCVFMNNLFDVLNSSTYKNDNIYKCALGSHESQTELLKEAIKVFSTIEWKLHEHGKANKRYSLPSFQVTLNSVISISQDLKELGHELILTERLNLAPLEKFIDLVRHEVSKTNEPVKPTAVEFSRQFSKQFKKNILTKTPLLNRPNAFRKYFEDATQLEKNKTYNVRSRSLVWLDGCTDYRIQLPGDHPTIYVASYIFYKCQEVHECDTLSKYAATLPDLSKTQVYDVYNRKATFHGKLKLLHYPFIRYIEELELAFMQSFKKCVWSNPGAQLFSDLRSIPFDPPCPCFPKLQAIRLLVRLRIFTTIKGYNKVIKRGNMNITDYISDLNNELVTVQ